MDELAHIYNVSERYDSAKAVCENILLRSRQEARQFVLLNEPAIYAMEDLAELCMLQGDSERSLNLLRKAHDAAFWLWGTDAQSTFCISKKLQAMNA